LIIILGCGSQTVTTRTPLTAHTSPIQEGVNALERIEVGAWPWEGHVEGSAKGVAPLNYSIERAARLATARPPSTIGPANTGAQFARSARDIVPRESNRSTRAAVAAP